MFYGGHGLHGASSSQHEFLMIDESEKYDIAHFEFVMRGIQKAIEMYPDKKDDISLSLHCETAEIMAAYTKLVQEEDKLEGLHAYSASRPPHSEGLAIFIASYLANETQLPNVNLLHLSSKKAVDAAMQMQTVFPHINFRKEVKEHQDTSRKGAEQKFKGGLADAKEETTKLHTVTHLTLAAMKELIDKDMEQKGANINAERMRFDFNSDERLTDEQLRSIEQWVNKAITSEAEVQMQVLTLDEAKKSGAHGTFDAKYGDKVKVYTIAGKDGTVYSKEICGGPHVETLKGIGTYKIKKQESVAAGIKRIKAVLE